MMNHNHFSRIIFYLIVILEATYGHNAQWLGHLSIDNGTDVRCAVVLIQAHTTSGLLRKDIALTSTRCLTKYPEWEKIKFRVVFTVTSGRNITVGVKRAIIHEKYDYRDEIYQIHPLFIAQFDVAVLKLETGEHGLPSLPIAMEASNRDCVFLSKKSKLSIDPATMTRVFPRTVSQEIWSTFLTVENEGRKIYEQVRMERVACQQMRMDLSASIIPDVESFASPLVCKEKDREVVKGLHFSTSARTSKTSQYTNVQNLSSWIVNAVKLIDEVSNFTEIIDKYASRVHNFSEVAQRHLLYLLEGTFGYVPTNFLDDIPSAKISVQANRVDQYLYKVQSKLNSFGIGDTRGYAKTNNPYYCVAICVQLNSKGLCNFMPSLERCYIIDRPFHFDYSLDIPHNQSLIIYTDETEFHRPSDIGAMTRSPEHGDYSAKWNVSLSTTAWPSFHCLGGLLSTTRGYYTSASFSQTCMQQIVLLKQSTATVHAILGSDVVQIEPKRLITSNANWFSIEIAPVPIPRNYPTRYGHKPNKSPLLRSYSPWSGAFMMAPGTMPWIVEIRSADMNVCMGVLINKWSVGKQSSMGNETSYVLTTARCAAKLSKTYRDRVNAGSYFLEKDSATKQSTYIHKVHVHEKYTVAATRQKTVNDIAILELGMSISLNRHAKCVKLFTAPPFSNYSIGAWNVEGGDGFRPLYEIPVRALVNAHGTFSTERRSDKEIKRQQALTDSILVGYKRGNREPQLFGFHSGLLTENGKPEDFYDHINKYDGWITSKLEN